MIRESAAKRAEAARRREEARKKESYLVTIEAGQNLDSKDIGDSNAKFKEAGVDVVVESQVLTSQAMSTVSCKNVDITAEANTRPIVAEKSSAFERNKEVFRQRHSVSANKAAAAQPPTDRRSSKTSKNGIPRPPRRSATEGTSKPSLSVVRRPRRLGNFPMARSESSPTISPQVVAKNRTLEELAELRSKKLAKYIHRQFHTMEERNAALKAAEEAILAQLQLKHQREQEQARDGSTAVKGENMGALDKLYMEQFSAAQADKKKEREAKEMMPKHTYSPTTADSSAGDGAGGKKKQLPFNLRGANPDSIGSGPPPASAGSGAEWKKVEVITPEVPVPVVVDDFDNKASANSALKAAEHRPTSISSANKTVEISPKSYDSSHSSQEDPSKETDASDSYFPMKAISFFGARLPKDAPQAPHDLSPTHSADHAAGYTGQRAYLYKHGKPLSLDEDGDDVDSESSLLIPDTAGNVSSTYVSLSPHEEAVRKAEEMARRMAEEVDWWCTTSDDSVDDDISLTSRSISSEPDENHWYTYWSDEYQREYYYNPSTNAVVWTIPEEDAEVELDNLSGEGDEEEASQSVRSKSSRRSEARPPGPTVEPSDYVPVMDFTKMSPPRPQPEALGFKEDLPKTSGRLRKLAARKRRKRRRIAAAVMALTLLGLLVAAYKMLKGGNKEILSAGQTTSENMVDREEKNSYASELKSSTESDSDSVKPVSQPDTTDDQKETPSAKESDEMKGYVGSSTADIELDRDSSRKENSVIAPELTKSASSDRDGGGKTDGKSASTRNSSEDDKQNTKKKNSKLKMPFFNWWSKSSEGASALSSEDKDSKKKQTEERNGSGITLFNWGNEKKKELTDEAQKDSDDHRGKERKGLSIPFFNSKESEKPVGDRHDGQKSEESGPTLSFFNWRSKNSEPATSGGSLSQRPTVCNVPFVYIFSKRCRVAAKETPLFEPDSEGFYGLN